MVFFDGALGLLLLGLWIFCVIDVITTPEDQCRNLPKLAWLLIVLLFFDVGSIVWLVAGRNWNKQTSAVSYKGVRGRPTASRPGRASNPDDDEDFQAQLRARVAEQRRRAQESRPDDDRPATA